MSYRIMPEHHHCHGHRTTQKTVTKHTTYLQNGEWAYLKFPQWYVEVDPPRKPELHLEHKDWIRNLWDRCYYWDIRNRMCLAYPADKWHEHKCHHCDKYLDMDRLIPIRLMKEYKDISFAVYFEKLEDGSYKLPGLQGKAYLDPTPNPRDPNDHPYDYVVCVDIFADCPSAQLKPRKSKFTVVMHATENNGKDKEGKDIPGREIKTVVLNGTVIVKPALIE